MRASNRRCSSVLAATRQAKSSLRQGGSLLTCATRARLSELMSDDLPTLGRPTTPTVMDVLMPCIGGAACGCDFG